MRAFLIFALTGLAAQLVGSLGMAYGVTSTSVPAASVVLHLHPAQLI